MLGKGGPMEKSLENTGNLMADDGISLQSTFFNRQSTFPIIP